MNNENLIRNEDLTPTQRRENARKAGKASAEAKRKKRTLREAMAFMMTNTELPDQIKQMLRGQGVSESDLTHTMVITRALIAKAEKGDVSAYNAIRDILGEKPSETLNIDVPKSLSISIVNVGSEYLAESEDDVQV